MDKILIIDDNPNDIEITRVVLEERGLDLEVASAKRCDLALEGLRRGEALPMLIILDLKMQGMDGIECLRAIRADARLQSVPVAVVTSSSRPGDEQDAYAAGANDFLFKAHDIDKYSNDLHSLIKRLKKD